MQKSVNARFMPQHLFCIPDKDFPSYSKQEDELSPQKLAEIAMATLRVSAQIRQKKLCRRLERVTLAIVVDQTIT
jgi:hypothetical protein